MNNQPSVSSRVLAFLLPAVLGLSCVERDWNFCSPDDKCRTGYTCTADWKCLRDVDGGGDRPLAVDSNSTADQAIGTDGPAVPDAGPAIGRDAAGPDSAPTSSPPDAAVSTSPDGPEPDAALLTVSSDAPVDTRADSPAAVPDAPAPDTRGPVLDTPADNTLPVPSGPEVGPDVPPTGCVIGGTTYASGAANPANTCQICKPATSLSGWSNADEGTSCNGGQYCNSGACKAGCFIDGAYYASGAANPANACQTCQTTYALTSWTASANGANCGTGQVCNGGTCQSGCWIQGALVGSGTTNSSNVCQICRPTASTSGSSNNDDGMSCGGGRTCSAGICQCATGTDCGTSGCINVTGSDSSHCGSCTNVCPTGQSCSSGKCACAKGAPTCGACLAWDFEWGSTPSPWSLELTPETTTPNGATNIALTQSRSHSGSYSLIAPILIDLVNTNIAEVTVSLPCKVNLSGYTGWAYVYFAGSYPLSDWTNQLLVDTWTSSGAKQDHVVPFFGNIPTNEWFQVPLGFQSAVPVDRIGITLTPSSNWTGTMYVDDVVINGL